jgi:hypothetical protein
MRNEKNNITNLKIKLVKFLSGIVKRIEFGNIIVDLQKAESIIKKRRVNPKREHKSW